MGKTGINQKRDENHLVTVGIDRELKDELSERGLKEGVKHTATWLRMELYRLGYGSMKGGAKRA